MMKTAILTAFLLIFTHSAFAAEAVMPIKATILQCGARNELVRACQQDDRCCPLLQAAQLADGNSTNDPVDEAMVDTRLINRNLGLYAHRADKGAAVEIVIE